MRNVICKLCLLFSALAIAFEPPVLAQNTPEIAKGNCKACAAVCKRTLDYCAKKPGRYSEAATVNALKDCIQACNGAYDYLDRGSSYGLKAAAITVDACTSCAKSCESFNSDDHMKACADECRKCAGNCQKIAEGKTASKPNM